MEEEIYFLENWLPSKDEVVEIIEGEAEISFEDVLFVGVGFGDIDVVDVDFEDGYEYVSAWVDEIKGDYF